VCRLVERDPASRLLDAASAGAFGASSARLLPEFKDNGKTMTPPHRRLILRDWKKNGDHFQNI
jgi:hypothetical protein